MADANGTVLVTGGSGYIGSWTVIGLLQQGYRVKTTVRNLAREAEVRAAIGKAVDPGDRLSFHAADLTADTGWDEAAAGCDYVIHVASPLGIGAQADPNTLIVPAREGARRAITAAIKAGAKRVVMTSSVAAASVSSRSKAKDSCTDEKVWTDLADGSHDAYTQSKTLAEQDAWALIKAEGGSTTLATVLPALVIGPVLSGDFSDSVQVVERLLTGRLPGLPRIGFNLVDVRDVADLHIRAMTDPAAAGERFIAAGKWAWMPDMADTLRARLGAAAPKVPSRRIPDFVLHIAGLFDKEIAWVAPSVGKVRDHTSAKAQKLLGWKPRPSEDSLIECARSLLAQGIGAPPAR
jgi:nucleoside-diphosphate-sugar epimerase